VEKDEIHFGVKISWGFLVGVGIYIYSVEWRNTCGAYVRSKFASEGL
jgi:hypothetical protein